MTTALFVEPLTILCATCHTPLERLEVIPQTDELPRFEFYQCQKEGCIALKLCIVFERGAGLAAVEPSFIQQEIARHGAFFPMTQDGLSVRRGPRNW